MPTSKKKVAKKVAKKVVVKPDQVPVPDTGKRFTIEIETGGEVYKIEHNSIVAAILGFDITNTNTRTIVRVSHKVGRKTFSVEKVFNVAYARRLFQNKITLEVFARNIMRAVNASD